MLSIQMQLLSVFSAANMFLLSCWQLSRHAACLTLFRVSLAGRATSDLTSDGYSMPPCTPIGQEYRLTISLECPLAPRKAKAKPDNAEDSRSASLRQLFRRLDATEVS